MLVTQCTLTNWLLVDGDGLGVGTTVQLVPVQRSANLVEVVGESAAPTAKQRAGPAHQTEASRPNGAPATGPITDHAGAAPAGAVDPAIPAIERAIANPV